MIKAYWKHLLAAYGAIMVIVGAAVAIGVIDFPLVLRTEFVVARNCNGHMWLQQYKGQKNDVDYQIYQIKRGGGKVPRFLFDRQKALEDKATDIEKELEKKK